MKNLLRIGLLAFLLPLYATAQIQWPDNLATKEYVQKTNARIDSIVKVLKGDIVVDPKPELEPCKAGPDILNVTGDRYGATIEFHGDNVTKLVVETRSVEGKFTQSDTISPGGSKISVKYEGLAVGTYLVRTHGVSCAGGSLAYKSFTVGEDAGGGGVDPPRPSVGARQIYMNTTGYGFDADNPNGINQDWQTRINAFTNLTYNGVKFSGITGVRLVVRWYEYEPTPGVYRDAELQKAINWITSKGLRISICLIPTRRAGDGMVANSDIAIGSDDQRTVANGYLGEYLISPNSADGNRKLKAVAKRLTQRLVATGVFDYMALGYGNTEEFYMPVIKDNKQEAIIYGTSYNEVDKLAWSQWLAAKGYDQIPVQIPPNFRDVYDAGNFWNTPNGHKWFDFITDGMSAMHYAFRDGIHEAGGKAAGFYADTGGAQSAWYMMYRLDKIFAGCDYIYSSDGGFKWDIMAKMRAIDFITGTFPDAIPAIEYDPDDLAPYDQYNDVRLPLGANLDWPRMGQYTESAFKRGAGIAHLAMGYSNGTEGNSVGDNINPSAEVLWNLKKKYLEVDDIPSLPQGETIYQQVTNYAGNQPYLRAWELNGGSLDKIVKIDTRTTSSTPARFESWNINSSKIGGKSGDVWLPKNYNSNKKYPVIYIFDGQTLYAKDNFADGYWNLDVLTQRYIDEGKIKDVIIVSIWSGDRMRDFLPNDPFYSMSQDGQSKIRRDNGGTPRGDEQITFITDELKPFIDQKYSTAKDRSNTIIMGASMGGLISVYAYGKRPDVFGKAAAVSIHYPGTLNEQDNSPFTGEMVKWITGSSFPNAFADGKLHFDRGTQSLDVNYEAPQNIVNSRLPAKGYNAGNLQTKVYNGQGHTPAEWATRLEDILRFLIPAN